MGQVTRFKHAKLPPTKARRIERAPVADVGAAVIELGQRYRAMAARARAHNVAVGVYAPARSTAVH